MDDQERIRHAARLALNQAMRDRGDRLVIQLTYQDDDGQRTRRVISPIRWISGQNFLALCLGRQEPRAFKFGKCTDVAIKKAADYVMPVPIVELA